MVNPPLPYKNMRVLFALFALFACSYFLRVLICETPHVECSRRSLFAELWHIGMLMTPPFGLMMFWLLEMRMRPLWMSAMRRPQMPRTMLAVLVRVTVTLTTLNSVVINLNSVMINVILNFLKGWGLKQWRFLSMYPPMRFLLMMKPRRRRRRGTSKQNGCSAEGKEHVMLLVKWCVITPPIHIKRRAVAMMGSIRVKIRNSWYATRGCPMQKLGPCHRWEASG